MTGLGEDAPRGAAEIWRRNLPVWAVLLALVLATLALAYVPLGSWNTPVSVGIGAAKAVLIAVFFMNLRRPDPLLRLTGVASLLWLMFLFLLTLSDVLTRASDTRPGSVTPRVGAADPGSSGRLF